MAHNKVVVEWASAIAQWLKPRQSSEPVSLLQLQQRLGLPMVEVWLGLLLSRNSMSGSSKGTFMTPMGFI
jgi:hypothetical protein